MYSYPIIPVFALSCYLFLLFSFIASKKNSLIKMYILVLVSMILWTGGSFFMRVNLYPSIKFWYDVSLTGILSCIFSYFGFVTLFLNGKLDKWFYIWTFVVMIMIVLNITTGCFLPAPTIIETTRGLEFVYTETSFMTYIFFIVTFLCIVQLVYRVYKNVKDDVDIIKKLIPLGLGILAMFIGNIIIFFPPFLGFPFDILAGVVNAFCMYYTVYQRRLFKLTLLVSKINIYFITCCLTALMFFYSINPIQEFINRNFAILGQYQTLVISILYTLVTIFLFNFFKIFIDKVFIKNEIHQNEALNEYSNNVNKTLDVDEVIDKTIGVIKDVLDTNDIYIALLENDNKTYTLHSDKKYFATSKLPSSCPIFEYLSNIDGCCYFNDFKRSIQYRTLWQNELQLIESLNIDVMVPLKSDSLIGAFLLVKKEKKNFKYDELVFLSSLASITSIAIKNSQLYEKVFNEARLDDLTGLYNRKYYYEMLEEEFNHLGSSLTLMNISIDDFRLYNQLYGNSEGDQALSNVAKLLKSIIGSSGKVARIQGKEFSAFLPNISLLQARNLAENIRKQVITINKNDVISAKVLTCSIGIAQIPTNATTLKQLIDYTDQSLYYAKREGKNCINIYNAETFKHNEERINKPNTEAYTNYSATIYALQAAIDTKDHYTFSHSENVAYYACELAKAYGLNEDNVEIIREAGLLHDIGKIGIPENILNKPGRLTQEEFEIMKTHVDNSISIIKHLPSLDYVIPAVISHHERYDGNGYPRRIKGNDIPLAGRILCVADSFDAMTSRRSYKDSYSVELALDELIRQSNRQFDPELAELFVKLVKEGKIVVQSEK